MRPDRLFLYATGLLRRLTLLGLMLIPAAGLAQDDLAARRARLESMSATEKEDLRRKEKRFYELSEVEQARLRSLHTEVTEAPDADKLQAVMSRYYEWLKMLRPGERAEVLSLPPHERIEKIRAMLEEQSIQRFQRMAASQLDPADVSLLFRWIHDYVTRHETELMATLGEDQRKLAQTNPRARRFMLVGALLRQEAEGVTISDEEVNGLMAGLSRPAQEILQKEKDTKQKIRVIRGWMEAAASSMFRNAGRPHAPISNEELMRFLEKELSDRDRAHLESLPAERFRSEAERMYHYYKHRRERERGTPPNPGGGPPGGGPPGGPRGGRPTPRGDQPCPSDKPPPG